MNKYLALLALLLIAIYYFGYLVVIPVVLSYFLNTKSEECTKNPSIELSYLQRVEADKKSIESKIDRLTRFMGSDTTQPSAAFLNLDPLEQCNLHDQRLYMRQYHQTLEKILQDSRTIP